MKVRKYLAPIRHAAPRVRNSVPRRFCVEPADSHGFELLALAKDDIATLVHWARGTWR